jgi:gamma-glutamyltranspeptidase/glutathione hydrolase
MASAVGMALLEQGGNAVDAAVGTALALAVTYPQAGNLGGGGFMLVKMPGHEVVCLDYRETAPRAAVPEHFLASELEHSVEGARAVCVPGTVAGLAAALERFGRLPWSRVVAPAIELAERGIWLTTRQAGYLELHHEFLLRFPSTARYFTDGGRPYSPGTHLRQPDLAATLRALADEGPRVFYEGRVAELIVREIAAAGGMLDAADLAAYQARWRAPLVRRFLGSEVHSAALPGAGGLVALLSLGLAEGCGLYQLDADAPERLDLLARTFRVAFALRRELAGDPDHLDAPGLEAVAAHLASCADAGELERLERQFRRPLPDASTRSASTTHLCVLDGDGAAVSNTFSLNTMYGSKLAVSGAGFLLNNSIDDFYIGAERPNWYQLEHGARNRVAPGRRPASSMAPTLVTEGDHVRLVIGGSGGPRIPTLIAQAIVRLVANGASVAEALRAPRIHHQCWPDVLAVEQSLPEKLAAALRARGHNVTRVPLLGMGAAISARPGQETLGACLDGRFGLE